VCVLPFEFWHIQKIAGLEEQHVSINFFSKLEKAMPWNNWNALCTV